MPPQIECQFKALYYIIILYIKGLNFIYSLSFMQEINFTNPAQSIKAFCSSPCASSISQAYTACGFTSTSNGFVMQNPMNMRKFNTTHHATSIISIL